MPLFLGTSDCGSNLPQPRPLLCHWLISGLRPQSYGLIAWGPCGTWWAPSTPLSRAWLGSTVAGSSWLWESGLLPHLDAVFGRRSVPLCWCRLGPAQSGCLLVGALGGSHLLHCLVTVLRLPISWVPEPGDAKRAS